MQDRSSASDRAEQIAALQRLLAQALASGVSARSMMPDALAKGLATPPRTPGAEPSPL